MLAPSYSSFRPARSETTPSSVTSVSFGVSNGDDAWVVPRGLHPVHLVTLVRIRGSFCGGLPIDSCSDLGSSRGFSP